MQAPRSRAVVRFPCGPRWVARRTHRIRGPFHRVASIPGRLRVAEGIDKEGSLSTIPFAAPGGVLQAPTASKVSTVPSASPGTGPHPGATRVDAGHPGRKGGCPRCPTGRTSIPSFLSFLVLPIQGFSGPSTDPAFGGLPLGFRRDPKDRASVLRPSCLAHPGAALGHQRTTAFGGFPLSCQRPKGRASTTNRHDRMNRRTASLDARTAARCRT